MILNISLIIFSIIILSLFLKQHYNYSKDYMSFRESLDLTDLPIITLSYNNRKLNFLLDTGSTLSHINERIFNSLNLDKVRNKTQVIGCSGNLETKYSCTINLKYHNKDFESILSITNLEEPFCKIKESTGVTIHGILGNDFFVKYKYIIDFNKLRVEI